MSGKSFFVRREEKARIRCFPKNTEIFGSQSQGLLK